MRRVTFVMALVLSAGCLLQAGCESERDLRGVEDDDSPFSSELQGEGLLDGKTFTILLEEPGKPAMPDDLIFVNGTMDSTACRPHGYSAAPYEAEQLDDETIRFTSDSHSGPHTMSWSGTVRGDEVSGRAVMSENGVEKTVFTFEGARKR